MSTTRLSARRAQRRSGSADGTPVQRPWRRVRNPYKPIEVLSADQLEFIHDASMEVLEELGLDHDFLVGAYERKPASVGITHEGPLPDERWNAAVLRRRGGRDAAWSSFRKVYLIPFGEFMPLGLPREVFSIVAASHTERCEPSRCLTRISPSQRPAVESAGKMWRAANSGSTRTG